MSELRAALIETALKWQARYGVAPQITTVLSELDASRLVGMPEQAYSDYMQDKTAVARGADFAWEGVRYQVKANRPSGKPGSRVTMVPKAMNYEWDILVWILYDPGYKIVEAWSWEVEEYKPRFDAVKRLSPAHYREGQRLA